MGFFIFVLVIFLLNRVLMSEFLFILVVFMSKIFMIGFFFLMVLRNFFIFNLSFFLLSVNVLFKNLRKMLFNFL